ncbi:FlgB family protein [Paracoccus sediminis]|jgi:flagellar basal-body rod protein FlgB|uniref:Flagellar basal-body rod protein FlgB n=1 Tax=Paracoccus sediminis TaxID=1214787 RepID=A0A238W462_9RHOB|nr:FlgB family protein [Paracoccus sediminis]TBN51548.1 FlgB family protein [Paracoccus sediminis]SNR41191.1 flagellar basal-body rod protein FlgB [Paracoccus sediminis]
MFEKIEMMRMARAMGSHASQRQITVARNIANADTPGFKAQDLQPFADSYRAASEPLRATDARHLQVADWTASSRPATTETGVSPNGNSVSLEEEMLKAAEVKRSYDLSLGIYRSALDLVRTSIGRRG